MSKFLGFLIFVLVFSPNEAQNSLCSVKKSENFCVCKRVTGQDQTWIVTEADCVRINLEKFPNQDQFTQDLNLLDLSHNAIESLDEEEVKFSSVILEVLILSYNKISSISDKFFVEVPNLRKLILSHNNITNVEGQIFQNLGKLTHLDLSFNNIKILPTNILQPLVNLQSLDLSYNDADLGEWLGQTPKSLSVDLGVTPNISILKMDNIGLKDLHNLYFANYTNLKHLSLADNHFQEIPRVPYTVEYLDLSGSQITTLQVKLLNYHSLKTLKLERMKLLENIHHYAFYNMEALEELSIKNCPNLKEFNELVFGDLQKNMPYHKLKKLSLSGNALQTLNSSYKHLFVNLEFIDLTYNPWKCDCDLLWLQEFEILYRSDNVKCSSPSILNAKKLFDLTDRNLPMCYPQKYGKKSHRIMIAVLSLLVIVLTGLVGYLIYYSPNFSSRVRGVGPQSPYNIARSEEQ